MSDLDPRLQEQLQVDADNLYREETYTDRRAARIRQLVPVTADGDNDPSREVQYIGETSVMTQMGALPLSFQVQAANLKGAFEAFPDGVAAALEELNERAKEMAREEASRIVVPTGGAGGIPGGPMGPGGGLILK